ncbi:MAG: histidine phosphatase family protein [Thermoleophilaceae bacterium]
MRRLLLIRHASTDAVRQTAFPLDEPLDAGGRWAVAGLAGRLGRGEALCSPAVRACETARALGLDPAPVAALRECDFGCWAGRTLAEVNEEHPDDARRWMLDPSARPHGGESLAELLERVGGWLDAQRGLDGRAIAVTHGGVVKAAVVNALGAPAAAFWRVDVRPLAVTELHGTDGGWTLTRANAAVVEAAA